MKNDPSRRAVLAMAGAAALLPSVFSRHVQASADVDREIEAFAQGRELQSGRIDLSVPDIAENGNAVPITVEVRSAMRDGDMVDSLIILADGNPRPQIATFHFTDLSGSAAVTTRMRLTRTQSVIALARMADGSVFAERKQVQVTIGGCTG